MEIGGKDLIITTKIGPNSQKRLIFSYFKRLWPNYVKDEEKDCIFYYKDPENKKSWENNGRTKENAKNMAMIFANQGHITIVHECLDEEEIRHNFRVNWCFT